MEFEPRAWQQHLRLHLTMVLSIAGALVSAFAVPPSLSRRMLFFIRLLNPPCKGSRHVVVGNCGSNYFCAEGGLEEPQELDWLSL